MSTQKQAQAIAGSGSATWLEKDQVTGNYWLRIETVTKAGSVIHEYEVEQDRAHGGFMLHRLDATYNLVTYKVSGAVHAGSVPALSTCNCPDAIHRKLQGGCKHVRALRAALAHPSCPEKYRQAQMQAQK